MIALLRRPIAWVFIGVAVLALVLWLTGALERGQRAQIEARLQAGRADAGIASGRDAAQTVGSQAASESAADQLSRENEHDIRTANGAGAPVDPDVHGAGLRGLCRRAAYRGSQQCLQHAATPGVAPGR